MPENCNPNDCPVSARVDALAKEFDRYREGSSNTHLQMFERIGVLETSGGVLQTKLDSIEKKLDEMTVTVKALADKPAKRWESLVGYIISALVGAFMLWMASGMPGVGK